MKLSNTHRIIKFKQSNWLEEYIEFNTEKRKEAVSSFKKNFFKIINKQHLWQMYGKFKKENKCQTD